MLNRLLNDTGNAKQSAQPHKTRNVKLKEYLRKLNTFTCNLDFAIFKSSVAAISKYLAL